MLKFTEIRQKISALIFGLYVIFLYPDLITSQCRLTPMQGTQYQTGSCNGLIFQSQIGSIIVPSGDCGNLRFTPGLTGYETSTSTSEVFSYKDFKVFPNPFTGRFTVTVPENLSEFNVELRSLVGQIIFTKKEYSGGASYSYETNTLHPGIYILRIVTDNNEQFQYKIIKI